MAEDQQDNIRGRCVQGNVKGLEQMAAGTKRWEEKGTDSALKPLEGVQPHQYLEIYFQLLAFTTEGMLF